MPSIDYTSSMLITVWETASKPVLLPNSFYLGFWDILCHVLIVDFPYFSESEKKILTFWLILYYISSKKLILTAFYSLSLQNHLET